MPGQHRDRAHLEVGDGGGDPRASARVHVLDGDVAGGDVDQGVLLLVRGRGSRRGRTARSRSHTSDAMTDLIRLLTKVTRFAGIDQKLGRLLPHP